MDKRVDELTQKVIKLRKYVREIGEGKNPAPLSNHPNKPKRVKKQTVYDEIPQDVLDKSYIIFKCYKDFQKLQNYKLCQRFLQIWTRASANKIPNYVDDENSRNQKQIENDSSDHFHKDEFEQINENDDNFQQCYGDDEPTEDDSSLKAIMELRIPAGE